jgi:hypothetical protein
MKDKLIIIETIKYILDQSASLIELPQHEKNIEKMGSLKTLFAVLLRMYEIITGNRWMDSPKDLHFWMIQYMKDQANALSSRN